MVQLDKEKIKQILPQSEPILLVDRGKLVDEANVETEVYIDPNWDIFRGHFKDDPVFPGVYIIENMAQTADVLLLSKTGHQGKQPMFGSVSQMRFIQSVYPGDLLCCKAQLVCDAGNGMYDFQVSSYCNEQKVAQGKITIVLR